jgi:hypothetical protein
MQTLLIAIRPEDIRMMTTALGAEFNIRLCHTLADAKAALAAPGNSDIDAIACGLHFDDGKMFDLLSYAKHYPDTQDIPFFCIKGAGGELTPAIFKAIVIATEKMGADGFIDISDLCGKIGAEATYAMLRNGLRGLFEAHSSADGERQGC